MLGDVKTLICGLSTVGGAFRMLSILIHPTSTRSWNRRLHLNGQKDQLGLEDGTTVAALVLWYFEFGSRSLSNQGQAAQRTIDPLPHTCQLKYGLYVPLTLNPNKASCYYDPEHSITHDNRLPTFLYSPPISCNASRDHLEHFDVC